jgi:hypothetical protein
MAYSDFDLKRAVTELGLSRGPDVDLFPGVEPVEPSPYLREWLAEFGSVALRMGSEFGRRESIIFPVLAEAKRHTPPPVTIAPGVTFEVDKARGLTGVCDYLISRSPETYYVDAPVAVVVEGKKDDPLSGLGQCAAELVAVRVFNEREGRALPLLFGCVTNGQEWKFLLLEGTTLSIDRPMYSLSQLPAILGILVRIASV